MLRDRSAFIYHGAGIAKGIGNQSTNAIPYLARLQKAVNEDLEICCSTVRPGDSELNLNFWGRIGLIIRPRHANSVTLVSSSDAGTVPDQAHYGRRQISRYPITSQALVESIDGRPSNSCNEWCVLDYDVIGVFIELPIQYLREDGALTDLKVDDVFKHFPGLHVYAFHNGTTLREVVPPCNWGRLVSVFDLYPI